MYTELHLNVELSKHTPDEVINVLRFMTNDIQDEPPHPNHLLFNTTRWRGMLLTDSYYFAGDTHSSLRQDYDGAWFLCIQCNLKNYDREIELFVDWIAPYIRDPHDRFLGFMRYEECDLPTLILRDDDGEIIWETVAREEAVDWRC